MIGITWLTFTPSKTNSGTPFILKMILFLLQSTCALQEDNQSIPSIASNFISPSLIKLINVFISPIITSQFTYLVWIQPTEILGVLVFDSYLPLLQKHYIWMSPKIKQCTSNMSWYGDHTFHYCIRGHCFSMGQCKCSSLSPWLLYRWFSHSRSRCITGLPKITGWSPRRVYSYSWPPTSSTRPLASAHHRTIFL